VIRIGDIKIGGGQIVVMAGPCAVESEKQCLTIAQSVKKSGGQDIPRRRLQTANIPLQFSGSRRRRPENPG